MLTKGQIIEKALVLHAEGKYLEASKYYQLFLDRGFIDPKVFSNLGVICQQNGEIDKAISLYKKSIQLFPDLPECYSNLGYIFKELRELEAAEKYTRKAIKINPSFANAFLNLGNIMKESANIALEFLKSNYYEFGINPSIFKNWDIHIHVPEGATPKDGPSAGIAMFIALVSLFTQRKVKSNIAMTGEITLRGKILPVGGIKEKILAAKRAGIKEVVLCSNNKNDISLIKKQYIKGLKIHYIDNMIDVVKVAINKTKVSNYKKIF